MICSFILYLLFYYWKRKYIEYRVYRIYMIFYTHIYLEYVYTNVYEYIYIYVSKKSENLISNCTYSKIAFILLV